MSDHILAQCGCGWEFELILGRTLIVLQNGDGRIVDAEVKCPKCGIPRMLEKVDHYKAPSQVVIIGPNAESDLSALAAYDQARHSEPTVIVHHVMNRRRRCGETPRADASKLART